MNRSLMLLISYGPGFCELRRGACTQVSVHLCASPRMATLPVGRRADTIRGVTRKLLGLGLGELLPGGGHERLDHRHDDLGSVEPKGRHDLLADAQLLGHLGDDLASGLGELSEDAVVRRLLLESEQVERLARVLDELAGLLDE